MDYIPAIHSYTLTHGHARDKPFSAYIYYLIRNFSLELSYSAVGIKPTAHINCFWVHVGTGTRDTFACACNWLDEYTCSQWRRAVFTVGEGKVVRPTILLLTKHDVIYNCVTLSLKYKDFVLS